VKLLNGNYSVHVSGGVQQVPEQEVPEGGG
jgi:hypothetical protein